MDSIEHGSYTHNGKRRTERVNTQRVVLGYTARGVNVEDVLQEMEMVPVTDSSSGAVG